MKGMECGLLPDTIVYNALLDRSLLDDIAMSDSVLACRIMDKRLPLITSYSARSGELLPPRDPGGRPKSEGITSDGQEGDFDA